jgi:hypothetical protein
MPDRTAVAYHPAMTRFGTDYQVGHSTGRCEATGQALEPGCPCMATLCDREGDEGFDRRDFSLTAWESGARPERLFSFWKTIVPAPDAKPRVLVDDAVLIDLFERLAADERPQRVAFRFVLALILMRKKQLKFTGRTTEGDVERWLLQPRGAAAEQPPFVAINPNLADDDVRDLLDQLGEILQGEL